MYIEVEIDEIGDIFGCYCSDIMPEDTHKPWVRYLKGLPEGHSQVRINIDTVTAMEIKAGSGQQPYQDPDTGALSIITVSQSDYITENFKVDMTCEHEHPKMGKGLPDGMKICGLERKSD